MGEGKICMMWEVVIPLLVTIVVKGNAKLMTHSKSENVVTEPIVDYSDHIATARSCCVLRLRIGKIDVCLINHSAKQFTLPKWMAIGDIALANIILVLLVLKPTEDNSAAGKATAQQGQSWS